MLDIDVIADPAAAAAALDPIRGRLLAELAEPASAAGLAARLGLPRQKINYHLRALETHKLVEPAGERAWGGLTERRFVATAASYVVSPTAMGPLAADPDRAGDKLSASYLIALAARAMREVGELWRRARAEDKRLATLAIDAELRFASPAARAAFTEDLTQAIAAVIARHHDEAAPIGRNFRLLVAAHPAPGPDAGKDQTCQ